MHTRVTSVGLLIVPRRDESICDSTHLDRVDIDALPSLPGVYIFRDEQNRPLYIGKSINIRSRVLSHLRTPESARMIQQSHHVECYRTAGEIGALLLESRLIKSLQPLHNRLLRRTREMCALRLIGKKERPVPEIVYARDHDFATTEHLYGLFATRKAAVEKLRLIVEQERLCPALTGLENPMRGRPCFARQLSRCLGACIGEESLQQHAARLQRALEQMRIVVWPYQGPVGIVEECDKWQQIHWIDHWFYLGSQDRKPRTKHDNVPREYRLTPQFDVDTYKILVKPMMRGDLRIEHGTGFAW